jgi:hypothetical protein
MIGHDERDGEIRIGVTALDSPSEREIARQERMKREGYKLSHKQRERAAASEPGERSGALGPPRASQ